MWQDKEFRGKIMNAAFGALWGAGTACVIIGLVCAMPVLGLIGAVLNLVACSLISLT